MSVRIVSFLNFYSPLRLIATGQRVRSLCPIGTVVGLWRAIRMQHICMLPGKARNGRVHMHALSIWHMVPCDLVARLNFVLLLLLVVTHGTAFTELWL